ncbi:MAG: adenylyltransferase/cytidyltransferase family protein [Endomicrobium sp.]|jgi:D-beta-D-heptose 7-phosphate kinase/D-beta-D-heptose 1-phosphate adenosyltransferase|nr:adenylyltransferase/cytidyltransferase family protein [Endomicrobium sp.]
MKNGILSKQSICKLVKELKSQGKKIVFTNGCFDLLHIGHIGLLNKAKKLGDVLIVAITSDKILNCLKGFKRPVTNEIERAKILITLKPVDYVFIFNEQTPKTILSELRPDVLVAGSNYKLSEIVGREFARVTYRFPFIQGKSTTNLISTILNLYQNN